MSEPLAYLITWTTYGTWLPGDARGWVDHHTAGPQQPIRDPQPKLAAWARRQLKHAPVRLSREQRQLVEDTIRETCQRSRWRLHAVNCRTNHVHVVVTAVDHSADHVMSHLKAWCSRRLNEHSGRREGKWWTRHGSTPGLYTERAVLSAIDYTLNQQ
jgi:REP element-mobilizing transposase RayT